MSKTVRCKIYDYEFNRLFFLTRMTLIEVFEDVVLSSPAKSVLYPIFRMVVQICYDSGTCFINQLLLPIKLYPSSSELLSEDTLKRWISARQKGELSETPHISVMRNWSDRLALFEEPVVQQFVEWILDDDDDQEESEEEEA